MQWIEQLKQLRSLYFMFICFNLPFSLYEPGINILLEVDKFQISNGTKMISRKGIAEVFSLGPRIVKIIWQKKLKCILIIIIFIKLKFWAARSEAHEVPSLPKQVQNTVGRNTEVYFLPWIDMADSGDKNFLLYDIHERYGPFSLTLYREKCRNQCFLHNFGLPDKMKLYMTIPCKKNSSKLCGSEFLLYVHQKLAICSVISVIFGAIPWYVVIIPWQYHSSNNSMAACLGKWKSWWTFGQR